MSNVIEYLEKQLTHIKYTGYFVNLKNLEKARQPNSVPDAFDILCEYFELRLGDYTPLDSEDPRKYQEKFIMMDTLYYQNESLLGLLMTYNN